jgi:chromate reductase, NAD(P)H dehydrogenase (quinone)
VSDPALLHKPIALWNVSVRGAYAQASLVEVLRTMSTRIVEEAGVTLPLLDGPLVPATIAGTPAIRDALRNALEAFARSIREAPAEQA